ncbi:hypothetical protein VTN00DRAFT_5167 [Thermoascus crustaceus]|uniref:uncharacterized protein n=1 Tax=Thermoascus crustaceus TaxID=5088 RepID=UPI003743C735
MDRIEKILADRLIKGSGNTIDTNVTSDIRPEVAPVAQPSVPCFGKLHFAGYKLGDISSYNGIPFFSAEGQQWVQSRTGQTVTFEKLCAFGPPWQNQRSQDWNTALMELQMQGQWELPHRCIVEEFAAVYRTSVMRLVFPIIDATLFSETIKVAYYQPQASYYIGNASARACIYAFLAFASVLNMHGKTLPAVDSEGCALKAQCLLLQVTQETATVDGLQTVIMLALYQLFSGNVRTASYLASLAARFIFVLGAHVRPTYTGPPPSPMDIISLTQYHLRNLFWLCYMVDKDLSLRTGQPPSINDEQCDLTLPSDYLENLYTDITIPDVPDSPARGPLFPLDLRLSMIKSRAYNALYSARGVQKTDAELLRAIRELDDELETWRMSLPPKYRPTLSFSHDTPIDPNMDMRSVMLRLDYHHCMAMIHQASSRCKAWAGSQSGVMEGVSSSLALSVEASRSTIFYLQTAEHVLGDESFWIILFYPMSALLTIFCNILLNPLNPESAKDLELLRTAPVLIRGIFARHLSVHEILHIKLVAEFVSELSRLAKCAIDKASSERSG